MNTIYAGRQLLELLGKERGNSIDAKVFFDKEFWPVMFKSEDHQHLMQVHNSDFFQSSYKKSAEKEKLDIAVYRKQKFEESIRAVVNGTKSVSGNIGVGFMASGPTETTFGQVSDLPFNFSEEQLLCSWYGGALGIGFGGGFDFLSTEPELLRFIYSGWPYYRRMVNETPKLKGRQIETWNGLWLLYGLKYRQKPDKAYNVLRQKINEHISTTGGIAKLDRPEWSKQILTLANEFGGDEFLIFQGYSFGSTNKTLGHLAVQLPRIKRLSKLFTYLIAQEKGLESRQITEVFKAHFKMRYAAQFGELGLRSLTPKDFPKYFGKDAPSLTKINKEKKKSPYQFITYKSWIIAMLNNEELHEFAINMAQELMAYKSVGKDAYSTEGDKIKNIEALWTMRKNSRFIDQLSIITGEISSPSLVFRDVTRAAATQMTPEQFQLFVSLVRFEYIFQLGQETSN